MDPSMELWNMFSTDMDEGPEDLLSEQSSNKYSGKKLGKRPNESSMNEDIDASCLLLHSLGGGEDDDADDNNSPSVKLKNPKLTASILRRSVHNASPLQNRNTERLADGTIVNFDLVIGYICPACGVEFDTQEEWKQHMNKAHRYNSRDGLNFVQLDKVYHRCRQCDKKIAMYSMENLLKHKFTHLPHRCTKCKICDRQYKYRQDLMVHLRIQHIDEIIRLSKEDAAACASVKSAADSPVPSIKVKQTLAIKEIQGGAHDIFSKSDNIPVRNEVLQSDDDENYDDDDDDDTNDDDSVINNGPMQKKMKLAGPAFAEDSRSSKSDNEDSLDNYIQYLCPQCGVESESFSEWRQHVESVHDFGNRKGLCFQDVNMGKQIQCLECNQVLSDAGLRSMQQHKFSHSTYPAWLVCKVCCVKFMEIPKIVHHLKFKHRLEGTFPDDIDDNEDSNELVSKKVRNMKRSSDDPYDNDDNDDALLYEPNQIKSEERDIYDPHIDYICPQCGLEIFHRKDWRRHIIEEHQLSDIQVLNFSVINDKQLKCNECGKIITNAYGIQNAQQHRITHMPYKAITKCRSCGKAYTDRKGLVKHLRTVHFVGQNEESNFSNSNQSANIFRNPNSNNSNSNSSFQFNTSLSSNTQLKRFNHNNTPSNHLKPSVVVREKRKQFVRHGNEVFEITYLDDDVPPSSFKRKSYDDDNANDDASLPELNFIGDNRETSFNNIKHKCKDCGAFFPTFIALNRHIKHEHEITEYHSKKPAPQKPQQSALKPITNAVDDDNLLILANGSENEHNRSRNFRQNGGRQFSNLPNAVFEKHISYICPACGLEVKSQVEWRRHINEVHNFDKREFLNFKQVGNQNYQCIECDDLITNNAKLKSLQDHHIRHLPYKLYIKCLLCFTRYNHKPNMISHLKVRHNITDNRTPQADGNADNTNTKTNNLKSNSVSQVPNTSNPANPIRNSKPRHSLNISNPKTAHNASNHNYNGSSSNLLVNNKIDRPSGLNTIEDSISFHNAVDLDFITYFCPQCNENFDSHVFWRKHIVEQHNLATREGLNFRQLDNHHYLCLECYKRVTVTHTKGAIGQLQSHKFRHLPYRSFKCLTCGNGFVRKQMLFKHLNRETMRCTNNQKTESTSTSAATTPSQTPYSTPQHTDNELNNDANSCFGDMLQQCHFTLVCPECGERFDTQKPWREHINIVHDLNKRNNLNIAKIGPQLHQCMDCGEHVRGNKLRALQAHKFKHLPHGPYLQCKYCSQGYNHIRNMQEHLTRKHSDLISKADNDNDNNNEIEALQSDLEHESATAVEANEIDTESATVANEPFEMDDEEQNGHNDQNDDIDIGSDDQPYDETPLIEEEDDNGDDDDDDNNNNDDDEENNNNNNDDEEEDNSHNNYDDDEEDNNNNDDDDDDGDDNHNNDDEDDNNEDDNNEDEGEGDDDNDLMEEPETVLGGNEDYTEENLIDYDEEQYLLG